LTPLALRAYHREGGEITFGILLAGEKDVMDLVDEKAVLTTLEDMARATIAKDVATLDRIYGDDVTYSHSSGRTETKAEILKNIQGPGIAEFMKFSDTTVRFYGDVALAKGITDFRNGRPGNLTDNRLNILWVMVRRPQGPHGWQIVARQTTRIGPSVGTPVPPNETTA
jgi:ketosteroid isomerase-like protein